MSRHHTVFALDDGTGSVDNVCRSPLLRKEVVTFVEGPAQVTLPRFHFTEKLQLVLIDGPRGYPFPDLEYFYLYPHMETGPCWFSMTSIFPRSIISSGFCGGTHCSNREK